MSQILDSVIDTCGNTPLVRLSRIGRDLPCELVAKCEIFNPGGSVKDRIGIRMLLDAEKEGRVKPGDTLIEPTSGNTGIGMALVAAVKGYRMIITMPEKMSHEKQVVLQALGAEIIRTPTEAPWDSPESHIGVAKRLNQVIPNSHILDQYSNPSNPAAHEITGQEIIDGCDGEIDAVVLTAGTGGTITGIARVFKRQLPKCQVIGVDPEGSILAGPGPITTYKVEGIGYDFVPEVLERGLIDRWIKSNDRDAFRVARQLIRQEGLLVGGSSGSAVWAAMKICKEMKPGQRVVTLLPDAVRNYMTKFLDDGWMRQHGFTEAAWEMGSIGDIVRSMPKRAVKCIDVEATLADAVTMFEKEGISQMPCLDAGKLSGIITEQDVLKVLLEGRAHLKSSIAEVMERNVATVKAHTGAGELPEIFERGEVALVVDEDSKVTALLTKIDLITYLSNRPA